jgi:hypothetical protein
VVLAVLAGEPTAADAARRQGCPFLDLESLRTAAAMPVSRFAPLAGIAERSYRRRLARLRTGVPAKGPWPAPRGS